MVVAIISLIVTIMLMVVLRFATSMESIEFLTDSGLTKLIGNIDLDEIYKLDGIMEGFKDIPLEMGGENNNIIVHIVNPENKSKYKSNCYSFIIVLTDFFFYLLTRFGINN